MQFAKRRRGRPHHNRLKVDRGTEELQQKRKGLLETGVLHDASLAESLLGIFYAHQMISRPLYEAGCFFGELGYRYEPCLGQLGRSRASSLTLLEIRNLGGGSCPLSDTQDEKLTQAWQKALRALKRAGSGPYRTVLKVIFYDQDLYMAPFASSFERESKPLREGLHCLEIYFKGGLQDRQGKRPDLDLNPARAKCQPHAPP
jgi:hypothetical protein